MKEATGELNITVITVIAIAAIASLFYAFVWPMIETSLKNNTCAVYGEGWHAVKVSGEENVINANGDRAKYKCCASDNKECIAAE